MKISDRLIEAIRADERSTYRIGQITGVDINVLTRFLRRDGNIGLANVEKLCEFFNLELTEKPLSEEQKRVADFVQQITE